jgi:tetratricopeptide (TPR) repeat protein
MCVWAFPIGRFLIFLGTWYFLTLACFFFTGTVHAFLFDFKEMEVPDGTVMVGANPENDLNTLQGMIAAAKKLAAEGSYAAAIAIYNDLINRNPQDAVLYFERGNLYYYLAISERPEQEKVHLLPPAGAEEPQPEPISLPGMEPATGASKPCERALADFNQAIALNRNYDIFFYMRGALLSSDFCPQHNLWKAIADYDRALGIQASNAVYHLERGLAWAKLNHYREAIGNIEQAIRLEPANYYFHYQKGILQEKMQLFPEAAASYQAALELAPPDRLGPFISALRKARKDSNGVLIADYTALIAKRPSASLFYIHRGLLYGNEKEFKSAIADFSTALSFQKDNGDLYFTRGKLFCEAGKKAEALKDFRSSCRLNHPAACYYGRILEKEIDRGDRWVPFWYSRDNRQYFYERKKMKAREGNLQVIRVRIEPDDSVMENLVVLQKETTEKDRGGYTLEWWEFNCPRSQLRISARKRFDRNGQVIVSYPDFEKTFRPVFPGGISDKLSGIACGKSNDRGTPKKRVYTRQDQPIFSP